MSYEDNTISNAFAKVLQDRLVKDYITNALNGFNTGITEDQFYAMNIVDASDITMNDLEFVRDAFPKYCGDNGCHAALPPFEEGAFIDRSERRYFHWKVLEIQPDHYRLSLDYYPLLVIDSDITGEHKGTDFTKLKHPCWYRAGHATVKVKLLTDAEYSKLVSYYPAPGVRTVSKPTNYIGGVLEDYEYFYTHDLMKIRKKGKYFTTTGEFINGTWIRNTVDTTLQFAAERGLHSMLFVSCGPLIEMFTYINIVLSNKSTSVSTHRTVSSIYALNPDIEDTRKERHFGTFTVVSEKKPRAINAGNIQRVYTTLAWQRRSHLRHYASGKVVPVKSATCRRHGAENAAAPQVVYKA